MTARKRRSASLQFFRWNAVFPKSELQLGEKFIRLEKPLHPMVFDPLGIEQQSRRGPDGAIPLAEATEIGGLVLHEISL